MSLFYSYILFLTLIGSKVGTSFAYLCNRHQFCSGGKSTSSIWRRRGDIRPSFLPQPLFVVSRSGRSLGGAGDGAKIRSKRQERVGHLVRTELAHILHTGNIKGVTELLDDDLRQRISVVNTDVSPDLRQARVSVSIRKGVVRDAATTADAPDDTVMEQRRAYSWLVSNTKALRHSLAQRMSHMKSCPSLTFVQVNVGAAVDVMYLIDKVSKGYKREVLTDDLLQEDEEDDDWIADVF